MEYLEIVETIIPFLINKIMTQIEDNIFASLESQSSASYTVNLAFNVMHQKCFDPYFQNDIEIEDFESKSTQKERFRAYDIKDIAPISVRITPKIDMYPKHQFTVPMQLWEDYEPQLVRQKTIEYVEEYPNERRIMEQKCIDKSNKEQLLRERSKEKRLLNEQYNRLIMQIGSKEYTYDYNCDPIARSKNQIQKDVITTLPFEVPKSDNNTVISKPKLVEQIRYKKKQADNEDTTIVEFIESQTQDIKLQPGVSLRFQTVQRKDTLQKQPSLQQKQTNEMINQTKYQKGFRNLVKLNDISLLTYLQQFDLDSNMDTLIQNRNQTQSVTPRHQSLMNQQTIKRDVLKLPKLRSHSINVRTKTKSRQQKSFSIVTYRD
ncbi:unnamed protein product (macronuclear) [Paramecium tetraurelia]|uniref:Uncharacterized protein n=1 Tax=Paramecium tetraurelia TaxID=5888 RepID=A0CN07_PARTE|nr:uncharacterized protein GSPATT00008615001 [Paramecium tetraurelia]CAK72174.1 unnamed protein product [Paramecium tetraurelia]|eukprot:XP_001439571.1 hypothetical protein (macronuclear) [Paramecium tetraurelia strain d4-2]